MQITCSCRYDVLRDLIEAPAHGVFNEAKFVSEVQHEQDRLDLFVSGKIVEVVTNLEHLDSHDDPALAKTVAEDILRVDTFVKHNLEGFRKIIKKFAKKTGLSTVWWVCRGGNFVPATPLLTL